MLRMTPHRFRAANTLGRYHHAPRQAASEAGGGGCYFGEKDERSVNAAVAAKAFLTRTGIYLLGTR